MLLNQSIEQPLGILLAALLQRHRVFKNQGSGYGRALPKQAGDLLCRLAARSNDHLHELIQQIVAIDGIVRSDSQLALHSPVRRTLADLIGR